MAIQFDAQKKVFSIHTQNTSYQMQVDANGALLHVYYGPRIPDTVEHLVYYQPRCFAGVPYGLNGQVYYSPDVLPREYPTAGMGDFRSNALVVRNGDGSVCCDLKYVSHTISQGKYGLQGLPAVFAGDEAQTLCVLMEDPVSKVRAQLLYGVLEQEDMITRSVILTNGGQQTVLLEKAASASLDFVGGDYDLISFWGRATWERNFQRTAIGHTNQVIGSRRGHSSHQYNPAVILADRNTTEDAGGCYGMMFVYSGNFMFEAEKDQFGTTRAVMGLHEDQFRYPLEPGERFTVPETVMTYAANGFSELSHRYHRCIREHLIRSKYRDQSRPVLINSWEAAYFNFTGETIYQLAREAADLGMDMVVLDDGWFGNRDNDRCGLGDWVPNEEKLGCPLETLISRINALGIQFGIWIEPEMVSEDSQLYREHPDWVLCPPGRKPSLSRTQMVLDFSRKEVRDHVFDMICAIMDKGNIAYIKWDMNRSLDDVYSLHTLPGKVTYDYMLGVYEFAERLITRYPDLLLEACCGGGGRFDAGMLYYAPQIWCSDNTDPIDRTSIQYGTSFFYPVSAVGAHVTAVPNHLSARVTSLDTRGVVAMAGTFGYEMDPAGLKEEERAVIRKQIRQYKDYEKLICTGSYYRLTDPDRDIFAAWQFVSQDGGEVLVNAVKLTMHGHNEYRYIKLKGLAPEGFYEDTATGKIYSGGALMYGGIPMNIWMKDRASFQTLLRRKE